ncbi:Clavaminate synthase-like protein, partial [Gonapodya prolifera JEL478]
MVGRPGKEAEEKQTGQRAQSAVDQLVEFVETELKNKTEPVSWASVERPAKRRRTEESASWTVIPPTISVAATPISFQIPVVDICPSLMDFASHLYRESSLAPKHLFPTYNSPITQIPPSHPLPFVVREYYSDPEECPALLWNDLRVLVQEIGADRTVPIEVGSKYTDDSWSQELVVVEDWVRSFAETGLLDSDAPVTYLAQHDLFAQIPRLRKSVPTPDLCYARSCPPDSPGPGRDEYQQGTAPPSVTAPDSPLVHFWFGPARTVSPLHTDPYDNLYLQLVGRKYVRLYDRREKERVGGRSDGAWMNNTSEIDDIENPDLELHPDFLKVPYVEAVLGPGDLLFIPVSLLSRYRPSYLSCSKQMCFWRLASGRMVALL